VDSPYDLTAAKWTVQEVLSTLLSHHSTWVLCILIKNIKWSWGCGSVVEHLPSMCKDLDLIPHHKKLNIKALG
jgi:hypothetical protein